MRKNVNDFSIYLFMSNKVLLRDTVISTDARDRSVYQIHDYR